MKFYVLITTDVLVSFIALFSNSSGVKINKLQVPEVIKHGSSVVLDCDFTLEETDQDLVVKWYFNHVLVYQWIPSVKKKPQGLGVLKDRLNLNYSASLEANSKHRALHILNASPELSGNYTCSVSTMQSEDVQTKEMIVLVSEKDLILRRLKADEGEMRVECLVDGIFPKPQLSLYSQEREIAADVKSRLRGKLYEVSAIVALPALKDPEEFTCRLSIPEANYTTRKETVFYPGNKGDHRGSQLRWWLTASLCLLSTSMGFNHMFIGGR